MTSSAVSSHPLPASAGVQPSRRGPGFALRLAAALTSALLGGFGLWFLLFPSSNPLVDPAQALVRVVLGTRACTFVLVGLAVLGLTAASLALSPGPAAPTPARRRALLGVALVELLGLGIALQSVTTIALAGYLVAMALPVALVWLTVQVVRRYRLLRWPVLLVAAAVVIVGYVNGPLRAQHLATLGRELAGGFGRQVPTLLFVVALALGTAAWSAVAVRLLQTGGESDRLGGWVDRHRRALTLLAAAGPLPYGLIRFSWLTPWPMLVPQESVLPPEIRLWGLLLGGGAALGCVLTVGLIRPWGVTFPRWMPRLAGRPVPPAAAIVPGSVVAGLVTASAVPMLRLTLAPAAGTVFSSVPVLDRVLGVLVFPFWFWGPALALAVWAYARSRR
jgi:hypothetical protein